MLSQIALVNLANTDIYAHSYTATHIKSTPEDTYAYRYLDIYAYGFVSSFVRDSDNDNDKNCYNVPSAFHIHVPHRTAIFSSAFTSSPRHSTDSRCSRPSIFFIHCHFRFRMSTLAGALWQWQTACRFVGQRISSLPLYGLLLVGQ